MISTLFMKHEEPVANANCGCDFKNFSWTQNEDSISIAIPLADIDRKDLSVKLDPELHLNISTPTKKIINGNLYAKVSDNDTILIDDGNILEIIMLKKNNDWWPKLLQEHKEVLLLGLSSEFERKEESLWDKTMGMFNWKGNHDAEE